MVFLMQKLEAAKVGGKKARSRFCSKVISSLKGADFSPKELGKLERIINEAEDRDEVLAQGIATVLDIAGIPPDGMDEIIKILEKAYENVKLGKDPVSEKDIEKLETLLREKISPNAIARIEANLSKSDEELFGALAKALEKRTARKERLKSTPKKK
ncbi:MAG: hypothetical protein ABIF01_05715 [Candidatus Micrarchaeota archaeon]